MSADINLPVFIFGGDAEILPTNTPSGTEEEVGAKAHGLMRMARAGISVPPGFVLGTALCRAYMREGKVPEGLDALLSRHLRQLALATGLSYGDTRRPLLVSVRSGAAASMPGMLETLLNVGLSEACVQGLIRRTGNPHLAWDCYRRLTQQFAEVVLKLDPQPFIRALEQTVQVEGASGPEELDTGSLRELARANAERIRALTPSEFPDAPREQLKAAIEAVWRSWQAPKAVEYRRLSGLDDSAGTAVMVQAMVFGNAGGRSGSGVGFTRNPATGENELVFDFLCNAQGEDIVGGRRTVRNINRLPSLPDVYGEILQLRRTLEHEFRDLVDFEFTVEDGRLYLLQARPAKRTAWAALHVAVDMVHEGLIEPAQALRRLEGIDLDTLERVHLNVPPNETPLAVALSAGLGVAVGAAAFTSERAQVLAAQGIAVVLVRPDMMTEDIIGIEAALGIVAARGSRTAHAAVVARQLGKVCLVGCAGLVVDEIEHTCRFGDRVVVEGDFLSLDGDRGHVYAGRFPVSKTRPVEAIAEVRGY